jgi:PAS domain S-box-containing protein
MVGYSRAELLTMYIFDLEVEESPEETAAHIKKVMELGYDRFETRHRHKQGYLVDLEISVSYSESDGGVNFVFTRDITERKLAEQQLKQALEFSEGIISAIPDVLFEMDRNGTYLNVWTQNPELLAAQKQALLGKNVHEVLSPESAAAAMDAIREADEKVTSVSRDICIDLPQGRFWFSHSLSKKPGNTSSAATFMVLSRDITERKQSEALLVQRESEFRTFAENMPDNIVRYNREGVTVYVNPALERTLGDRAAAMIGTTPREYHPDGSYEDYAQLLDAVLASGEAGELEKTLPGPGGEARIHQIRMVSERGENGDVVGVLVIGRDITERKRMEESLVRRERELRALAESSPGMMGSFYFRPDGSVCMPYVSSKIWEFFGLTPQDVATDATPLLARTHPDDAQMIRDSIAKSARTLTPWHEEYRILHPTKGELWMESHTNPEHHSDGGVIWFGYVHDITERKRAEEALRASERQFRTLAENFPDILIRYDREGLSP